MDTLFDESDADEAVEAIVRWNKIISNRERNNKMQLIMSEDGNVVEVIESQAIDRDTLVANVNEMESCLNQANKDLAEFDAFVLANDQVAIAETTPEVVVPEPAGEPILMPTVDTPAATETPATPEVPVETATTEASPVEQPVEPTPIVLQ